MLRFSGQEVAVMTPDQVVKLTVATFTFLTAAIKVLAQFLLSRKPQEKTLLF